MTELIRQSYLDSILPYRGKRLIKVLVGLRRVGKTTLLRQIMSRETNPHKVLCINMEDSDFSHLSTDKELSPYLESAVQDGIRSLYIDEIQMIWGWERSINSLFSKYPTLDIYLTGSNSQLLSSELTTLLRGRYVSFEIFPFSYSEFCEYHDLPTGSESWKHYMTLGTTPTNYMLAEPSLIREWTKNLISTIFLKDIIERYRIKEASTLEEVFLFFINNISNLISLSVIHRTLQSKGVSLNLTTLGNYVEYLKQSFLIYEVNLYDLRGKQILVRDRKLYLADPLYRSVYFSGYDAGVGKILENLVFLEIRRRGYTVWVGRLWDREIDFVIDRDGIRKYIQVAYLLSDEAVIAREFGNLVSIWDSWEKYVLSMDELSFWVIDGVRHLRVWEMDQIFE